MVNALHKWLIAIFWETAEASNSQIRSMVVPKSLYIVTGNDIIGHFRSATNSVNAIGVTAIYRVWIISESARASNFEIYHAIAHDSLYIST